MQIDMTTHTALGNKILAALTASEEAGYASGNYVSRNATKEERDAAHQKSAALVSEMWQAFYALWPDPYPFPQLGVAPTPNVPTQDKE